MHIKTMEGLTGANTNHNLLKVPVRVFKDARRRGDLGTMERAMEYAEDFAGKTKEYQTKAEEGMEEDAKEAAEKVKEDQEKLIEKCREDRIEQEERTQEIAEKTGGDPGKEQLKWGDAGPDILEISEEGQRLADNWALPAKPMGSGENPAAKGLPLIAPKGMPVFGGEGNSGASAAGKGAISVKV